MEADSSLAEPLGEDRVWVTPEQRAELHRAKNSDLQKLDRRKACCVKLLMCSSLLSNNRNLIVTLRNLHCIYFLAKNISLESYQSKEFRYSFPYFSQSTRTVSTDPLVGMMFLLTPFSPVSHLIIIGVILRVLPQPWRAET